MLEEEPGPSELRTSLWVGLVMVRRSEGCSMGDRGFSTHLLGVLPMAAGGAVGSVKDGGSEGGIC